MEENFIILFFVICYNLPFSKLPLCSTHCTVGEIGGSRGHCSFNLMSNNCPYVQQYTYLSLYQWFVGIAISSKAISRTQNTQTSNFWTVWATEMAKYKKW